jgi:RimJ/RimL family protein N-acetyltransferase
MTIPTLTTERLLLKPLVAEDAAQIQKLYPRWEIVRYMVSSVPWPYPDNGAENYVNNVALPDMAKGIAWFWSIRRREVPDELMGIICLYDVEDNNRGFWLAPEFQGQGYARGQHCRDGLLVQYAKQTRIARAESRRQQPLPAYFRQ